MTYRKLQPSDVNTGPTLDHGGAVHVPAYAVPLSSYMSPLAKQRFVDTAFQKRMDDQKPPSTMAEARQAYDQAHIIRPLERAKALYPVHIEERSIDGVRVDIVTPRGGVPAKNAHR